MPADREIHFGFIGPAAIYDAIDALGVTAIDYATDQPVTTAELRAARSLDFEIDANAIEPQIQAAWDAITARLGWTPQGHDKMGYPVYDTPYGRRTMGRFHLCLQFDEDEIGDAPEDATLGINLSARYFPAILDAKDPHGTLGGAIMYDELAPQIEICREEIVRQLPHFEGAKVFIRDIFY